MLLTLLFALFAIVEAAISYCSSNKYNGQEWQYFKDYVGLFIINILFTVRFYEWP